MPKKSGIYKITINDKFYIGQTNNFQARKAQHLNKLRNNKHANQKMQNTYNKYGEEQLSFEILVVCRNPYSTELEQKLIDKYKDDINFLNLNLEAGTPPTFSGENNPFFGKKQTPEMKEKFRNSMAKKLELDPEYYKRKGLLSRGWSMTEEARNKLAERNRGRITSEETKLKQSEAHKGKPKPQGYGEMMSEIKAKTYQFTDPQNQFVEVTNLTKYCKDNKLDSKSMFKIQSGKLKSYKGWTL